MAGKKRTVTQVLVTVAHPSWVSAAGMAEEIRERVNTGNCRWFDGPDVYVRKTRVVPAVQP